MEKVKFNVGDVVRLVSGGPAMTVESVGDRKVTCVFFSSDALLRRIFFPECLDIVPIFRFKSTTGPAPAAAGRELGKKLPKDITDYCRTHGLSRDYNGDGWSFQAPQGFHFAGSGLHEECCISTAERFWEIVQAGFEPCGEECEWWGISDDDGLLETGTSAMRYRWMVIEKAVSGLYKVYSAGEYENGPGCRHPECDMNTLEGAQKWIDGYIDEVKEGAE